MNLESLGKMLLVFAVILFLVGGALFLFGKFTSVPRLPGDILIRRGNFSFYFPLGTSVVVSVALTLLLNLIIYLFRR